MMLYGMNELMKFLLNDWKVRTWYALRLGSQPRIIVQLQMHKPFSEAYTSWEI
jgi:hypothetical protein